MDCILYCDLSKEFDNVKNKDLIFLVKTNQIKLEIMKNSEYKSYRDMSRYYLMRIELGLQGMKFGWWEDKLNAKL